MPKLLLAAVAALFASTAAAQMYRWVDKDGKVHYTDTPPPATAAKQVEKRTSTPSVVQSTTPYAVQEAAKKFPAVLYTHSSCKDPCAAARDLLAKRGVPFREIAVTDEKTRAELKKASGGEEVPVLTLGTRPTVGFETETWQSALDGAGYPRNAAPLAAQKAGAAKGEPAAAAKPDAPAAPSDAGKAEAPAQSAAAKPAAPAPGGRYAPLPADPKAPPPAAGAYAPK